MNENYQRIALDPDKRHLVFGDIHGRHTTFLALLDQLAYNPSTDVIYSVGDLIDRGPDSVAVVEFFIQEHCHVVRGNHEQMVIGPEHWRETWLHPHNGGPNTLASLEQHGRDLDWLAGFCNSLPIVLDVGDDADPGAFRIVHAESPFAWSETYLQDLLAHTPSIVLGESRLLWGRDDVVAAAAQQSLNPNEDGRLSCHPERSSRPVFCGHTPLHDVITASGTHWIDTWAGGFMTCVELATMDIHTMPLTDLDAGLTR